MPEYQLYDYQKRASNELAGRDRNMLVSPMGSGKTLICLDVFRRCGYRKMLVIAPLAIAKSVWVEEAGKWMPNLKIGIALGSPAKRRKILEGDYDIYVISRDSIAKTELGSFPQIDMLVLDEATSFKTHSAARTKAVVKILQRLMPTKVVSFTGTVISNSLMDFFSMYQTIGVRLEQSFFSFRRRWFRPTKIIRNIAVDFAPKPEAAEEITELAAPFTTTIDKSELTYDDFGSLNLNIRVDLDKYADYKSFEKFWIYQTLGESKDITAKSAATLFGKLTQWTGGFLYNEMPAAAGAKMGATAAKQTYERVDKSKVQALKELLEKTDEPVLIFVKYIAEAEIVKNEIAGAEIFSTDKIERWNNGEIKRMIANPKSMGHGLNLQRGGRIIVWYNITASLELYEQANARVYRHGQKERVIIYNLLCKGSIDEVIRFRILKKKENLKDAVMGLLAGQTP